MLACRHCAPIGGCAVGLFRHRRAREPLDQPLDEGESILGFVRPAGHEQPAASVGLPEPIGVRLGLHELDHRERIDRGVGSELEPPARRSNVDAVDAEARRLKLDRGGTEQVARGIREQPEAVDHLDLEFVESVLVGSARDPLVHDESGVDVGQVVVGDQRRYVQVDLVTRAQGLVDLRRLAGLDAGDGTFEHLHVQ